MPRRTVAPLLLASATLAAAPAVLPDTTRNRFPAAAAAQEPQGTGDAPRARVPSPFDPDTVLASPGGPRIVLLRAPSAGVAALRLVVPLAEGPAEAGAGNVLRDLAQERMENLARPVGALVEASRTPWGLSYAVLGAAADFEYLAYLLREAVAEPRAVGPSFLTARRQAEEAARRAWEVPSARLAADLRGQLAPGFPPPEGTPRSVASLDGARVREVWRRSHGPRAMTLVVSAPVVPEVVLAATRGMGAPEDAAAGPLDAPTLAEERVGPRVQSLRSWYGEAYRAGPQGDPHAPVAALLVAEQLRGAGAPGFEAGVQLWELPTGWVLAVTGAAYRAGARAMRRAVVEAIPSTRAALTEERARAAVAAVRGGLFLGARTPAGLVAAVARALEPSGDPYAAGAYAAALEEVDRASLDRFLTDLLAAGPVRAEVRP